MSARLCLLGLLAACTPAPVPDEVPSPSPTPAREVPCDLSIGELVPSNGGVIGPDDEIRIAMARGVPTFEMRDAEEREVVVVSTRLGGPWWAVWPIVSLRMGETYSLQLSSPSCVLEPLAFTVGAPTPVTDAVGDETVYRVDVGQAGSFALLLFAGLERDVYVDWVRHDLVRLVFAEGGRADPCLATVDVHGTFDGRRFVGSVASADLGSTVLRDLRVVLDDAAYGRTQVSATLSMRLEVQWFADAIDATADDICTELAPFGADCVPCEPSSKAWCVDAPLTDGPMQVRGLAYEPRTADRARACMDSGL